MLWSMDSISSCTYHVVLSCSEQTNPIALGILLGSKHRLEVNPALQMFSFGSAYIDRNGTLIIRNASSSTQF